MTRNPPTTRLRGQRRSRRTLDRLSATVCRNTDGLQRLADEHRLIAAGFELHQRLFVPADDDDGHVGIIGAALHDEIEAVVASQPHVGDEQIVGLRGEQALGRVVGRGAGHVVLGIAQQFHDAGKGIFVVVENEDPIR